MSNTGFPVLPLPDDESGAGGDPTLEAGDQEVLDEDADEDLIDSADADRLAAEAPDDER